MLHFALWVYIECAICWLVQAFLTEILFILFYFNLKALFCVDDCHELQKIVGEPQILLLVALLLMSSVFLDMFPALCYITPHSQLLLYLLSKGVKKIIFTKAKQFGLKNLFLLF